MSKFKTMAAAGSAIALLAAVGAANAAEVPSKGSNKLTQPERAGPAARSPKLAQATPGRAAGRRNRQEQPAPDATEPPANPPAPGIPTVTPMNNFLPIAGGIGGIAGGVGGIVAAVNSGNNASP